MNIWQRGMAALGFVRHPEKLFRASRFMRDSNGDKSLCFMVTDENDISALIRMFATHGVKMVAAKSGIDRFKVLKITQENINKLPAGAKSWLLDLHSAIKTITDDRIPGNLAVIKSAIKDIKWTTDKKGKCVLYFIPKKSENLETIERFLANNGIKTTQQNAEKVLKITWDEIENLSSNKRFWLLEVINNISMPVIPPDRQR